MKKIAILLVLLMFCMTSLMTVYAAPTVSVAFSGTSYTYSSAYTDSSLTGYGMGTITYGYGTINIGLAAYGYNMSGSNVRGVEFYGTEGTTKSTTDWSSYPYQYQFRAMGKVVSGTTSGTATAGIR